MKKIGIIMLILIFIGVVMFALNPTSEDLNKYLDRKADSNVKRYVGGSKDEMDKMLNNDGAPAKNYAAVNFDRKNYYVLSIYKSESVDSESIKYCGVFKVFFKIE